MKQAGIELSEYYMPGLGGRELSRRHALESAKALSRIDPDFIRLRTLALPDGLELADEAAAAAGPWATGRWRRNCCSFSKRSPASPAGW